MPIYEYRCLDCRTRSTLLVLRPKENTPACTSCGSSRLEKIMSRFLSPKSEEARMKALADPANFGDLDENDPQSMARFMKKMGKEVGEDLGEDIEAALEGVGETDDSSVLPE